MVKIISSFADDDTLASLSHSRAPRMAPAPALRAEYHHHHHHPITPRAPPQDRRRPGSMATRMEDDQDRRYRERTGWTTGMDDRDGRPGWTSRMDGNEDRRRRKPKTKTEDRRRGEEAGNRTVALPKRQSTLAVDLLKRSLKILLSFLGRGGTEEDSDKDGRLSEDGEADGQGLMMMLMMMMLRRCHPRLALSSILGAILEVR
ncbi:hypothetical protein TYRP_009425 [Tyrophagus putrescentiae]|nr:hypothetical protein TYRP_009425 [Tyrophagus putrescentiae]